MNPIAALRHCLSRPQPPAEPEPITPVDPYVVSLVVNGQQRHSEFYATGIFASDAPDDSDWAYEIAYQRARTLHAAEGQPIMGRRPHQ